MYDDSSYRHTTNMLDPLSIIPGRIWIRSIIIKNSEAQPFFCSPHKGAPIGPPRQITYI